MKNRCVVCRGLGTIEKNIIPKSLLRKAPVEFLLTSDIVHICNKCFNNFSCKSDQVVQNMCSTNSFEYLSEHRINKKINTLRTAAETLIDNTVDFVDNSHSRVVSEYLCRDFNRQDLNDIMLLKNNGDNPRLHVGAFLRRAIGTQILFDIFRSNFHQFKSNYTDEVSKSKRVRKGKYHIARVIEKIKYWKEVDQCSEDKKWVRFDGDPIDISSYRYDMFYAKGVSCVSCGVVGKYFIKERLGIRPFHFNLYGLDSDGKEVLMTVDHIYPRGKGGKDELSNFQPMCSPCNSRKADNIEG
jgi:hypothetical protein